MESQAESKLVKEKKSMTEISNPLTTFFHVVMNELRKRLTPAEFAAAPEVVKKYYDP